MHMHHIFFINSSVYRYLCCFDIVETINTGIHQGLVAQAEKILTVQEAE